MENRERGCCTICGCMVPGLSKSDAFGTELPVSYRARQEMGE